MSEATQWLEQLKATGQLSQLEQDYLTERFKFNNLTMEAQRSVVEISELTQGLFELVRSIDESGQVIDAILEKVGSEGH